MLSFEDADTEETVTCLQMTVYHPSQQQSGIFKSIRFCNKEKFPSVEVVRFGRNSNVCRYTFQDKQVSRVQFALQPFKQFNSSVLSFEIKNMSKKTSLMVDNQELGYLNKMDLPYKCMLRFESISSCWRRKMGSQWNLLRHSLSCLRDHSYKKTTVQRRVLYPRMGLFILFHP